MAEAKTTKTTKKTAPKRTTVKKKTVETKVPAESSMSSAPFKMELLSKRNKKILIAVIVLVLLGIIAFASRSLFIAALVNGQPISRLKVVQELETQHGANLLGRLIDKSLIEQEAKTKNVTVTDDEVNKRYQQELQNYAAGNEENFNQMLTTYGLTKEVYMDELRIQILTEKLLGDKGNVTDQEFEDFLKQNPDLTKDQANQEDARKQIRDSLNAEKIKSAYNAYINELREKAEIVRLVGY